MLLLYTLLLVAQVARGEGAASEAVSNTTIVGQPLHTMPTSTKTAVISIRPSDSSSDSSTTKITRTSTSTIYVTVRPTTSSTPSSSRNATTSKTTLQSTKITSVSNATSSKLCTANCDFAYPTRHVYTWSKAMYTETITAATVAVIINTRRNTTSTTTRFVELPKGFTLPPLNEKGTHIVATTVPGTDNKMTTTTMTYPNLHWDYASTYEWSGQLNTTISGQVMCVSARGVSTVTLRSHPPYIPSNPKPITTDPSDPRGLNYYLIREFTGILSDRTMFPEFNSFTGCNQHAVAPAAAFPTVSFLFETRTELDDTPPDMTAADPGPSVPPRPGSPLTANPAPTGIVGQPAAPGGNFNPGFRPLPTFGSGSPAGIPMLDTGVPPSPGQGARLGQVNGIPQQGQGQGSGSGQPQVQGGGSLGPDDGAIPLDSSGGGSVGGGLGRPPTNGLVPGGAQPGGQSLDGGLDGGEYVGPAVGGGGGGGSSGSRTSAGLGSNGGSKGSTKGATGTARLPTGTGSPGGASSSGPKNSAGAMGRLRTDWSSCCILMILSTLLALGI